MEKICAIKLKNI